MATDEQDARYIQALVAELAMYEQNGKEDRAEAVRKELRRLGRDAQSPQKRAEKRPAAKVETR